MRPSLFKDIWPHFLERLRSINESLVSEINDCWDDQQNILSSQILHLEAVSSPRLSHSNLISLEAALGVASGKLLGQPLAQWERARPYRRALTAIENYDRRLEELLAEVPESICLSGTEALSEISDCSSLWKRLALLRRKERELHLKTIFAGAFRRLAIRRSQLEDRFFLALAQAINQMGRPWEFVSTMIESAANGRAFQDHFIQSRAQRIQSSCRALIEQGNSAVAQWGKWHDYAAKSMADEVLANLVWKRTGNIPHEQDRRAAHVTHWTDQRRAAEAALRLQAALERSERMALLASQRMLQDISEEQSDILAEIDSVVEWLRRQVGHGSSEPFPAAKCDVISAPNRLLELDRAFRNEMEQLPQPCAILSRFSASPTRRKKWRKLYPRKTLYEGFCRAGRQRISRLLEEIEDSHYKLVSEIERAREVVAFGLEATEGETEADSALAKEAARMRCHCLSIIAGRLAIPAQPQALN